MREAAAQADVVAVTVPFAAQRPTLESIRDGCRGKIVIDVTVPPGPAAGEPGPASTRGFRRARDPGGAGRGGARRIRLPERECGSSRRAGPPIDCDVLVCGDDPEAPRGRGPARCRRRAQGRSRRPPSQTRWRRRALTSVLIWLNQRHKVAGTGIPYHRAPGGVTGGKPPGAGRHDSSRAAYHGPSPDSPGPARRRRGRPPSGRHRMFERCLARRRRGGGRAEDSCPSPKGGWCGSPTWFRRRARPSWPPVSGRTRARSR